MIDDPDNQIKEWPALSAVKFICVAMLIFVHSHMALITESSIIMNPFGFYYKVTKGLMFLGLFLVILPAVAGAVLRIDLDKDFIQGKLRKDYDFNQIIKTAVFLILVGFLMNMIAFGGAYTFSWNVLQLVGLSFVVIVFLLKKFPINTVFWLGLIALFIGGPLSHLLGSWNYTYLAGVFTGINNSLIVWPFFPWFGVVALGFLIAHCYLKYKDSAKFRISLLAIGLGLLLVAILRGEISPYLDPNYVWGPSIVDPKIGWVLASIGFFCLLVAVANTFLNKRRFSKYGIINSYSKGILWIYVIQMFASEKLSLIVKRFFPMNGPSTAYFILPITLLLLCWLIGALCIKFLQGKSIVIKLRKFQ